MCCSLSCPVKSDVWKNILKLCDFIECLRLEEDLWSSSAPFVLLEQGYVELVAQGFVLYVVWSLLNVMFKTWYMYKYIHCTVWSCASVLTEEKGFLVTFHLEFGTIRRCRKHNSVLCYF